MNMKKNAFAICILMILVPLSGCAGSVENDIRDESQEIASLEDEIAFPYLSEGDWVEGEFGVIVTTTSLLEAEYLELWVNGQLEDTASMDDSVFFSIDSSSHSDGTGAPVTLELEIRVETHGVGEMNLTAIFPQRLTDNPAEDIQPE